MRPQGVYDALNRETRGSKAEDEECNIKVESFSSLSSKMVSASAVPK